LSDLKLFKNLWVRENNWRRRKKYDIHGTSSSLGNLVSRDLGRS